MSKMVESMSLLSCATVIFKLPLLFPILAVIITMTFSIPGCRAQAYKDAFLTGHNKKRADHSAPPMTLDAAMTTEAQRCAVVYANQKDIDHSCKSKGMGENLYAQMSSGKVTNDDVSLVNDAIEGWYDERKDYNYDDPSKQTGVVGHFTQVVWIKSTKLGVGVARHPDKKYVAVVGKYSPHGNIQMPGKDMYKLYKQNVKHHINEAPSSIKISLTVTIIALGFYTLWRFLQIVLL